MAGKLSFVSQFDFNIFVHKMGPLKNNPQGQNLIKNLCLFLASKNVYFLFDMLPIFFVLLVLGLLDGCVGR